MSRGKVLVVLSSTSSITLANGKVIQTGFFLSELMKPLQKIMDSGISPVFANPLGNPPAMDPTSDASLWYGFKRSEYIKHKDLLRQWEIDGLFQPRKLSDITENELFGFNGVFLPGGHAPMNDLPYDKDLGRILLHFHQFNKPIGAICHGPAGLLSPLAAQPELAWPFAGYEMSCYSNNEEKMMELMWRGDLPWKLETKLATLGGRMRENWPMVPKVTVDRELISAQGPTSAGQFGDRFVQALLAGPVISKVGVMG
eukprot:GILK01013574.1.p1 GENE.GILK01013574.1~~GILK01013574.1.p1  ORF type:complete len:256 (-),score=36.75 GILK01013574.1:70-837(-)